MKKKPLAYYLDLIKSAGDNKEWLKAKRYGETALKKLSQLTYSPIEEYSLYFRLGYIYDFFADYSRSIDFFYKARLIASKNNLSPVYIAHSTSMIGISFGRINSMDKALEQLKKVDEYFEKYGCNTPPMGKDRFIRHLIDVAYCYLYKKEFDKAREIIEKKLTAFMPFSSTLIAGSYQHLNGEYLIAKGEYEKAKKSINEFICLRQKENFTRSVFDGEIHIAVIDLLEGNLDSAIKSLLKISKEALKEKQNEFICMAGLLLSKCYALKTLPEKSAAAEKRIKPILSKLDTTWLYEQMREFEELYRKLEPIYHNNKTNSIPAVLSAAIGKHNEEISVKNKIIGNSLRMQEIFQLVEKIAPTDLPILIQGETGTGKELIARYIYRYSLRREKPFLAINCSAVSETLLENELFGHAKGAFTDAHQDRKGYIESASGGTLFLDEISEMPLAMQQKLLRVLEEKLIWRVGAEKPVPVDTRFIFASNKNIEGLVKAKKFREDLYYRINTMVITLPPLRDRKDDIPLLINHFLDKYDFHKTQDAPMSIGTPFYYAQRITPDALSLLQDYSWPGNIRELENEIKRICTLYPKVQSIKVSMLSESIKKGTKASSPAGANLRELKELYEKNLIIEALDKHNWNIARAAKELGCLRPHLSRRIKQLKLAQGMDITKR